MNQTGRRECHSARIGPCQLRGGPLVIHEMYKVLMITSRWPPEPSGWDAALIARQLGEQAQLTVALTTGHQVTPSDLLPDSVRVEQLGNSHGRDLSELGPRSVERTAGMSLSRAAVLIRDTYEPVPAVLELINDLGRQADVVVFGGADEAVANGLGIVASKAILTPLGQVGSEPTTRLALAITPMVVHLSPGEARAAEAFIRGSSATLAPDDPMAFRREQPIALSPSQRFLDLRQGGPVALAVGSADLRNSFDELIANWCALMDRPYTADRTLIVAGADPPLVPDRPDVVSVAVDNLLELRRLLMIADLLMLPARSESGFHLMSDAWRVGVAVLASSHNEPIRRDLEASSGGLTYSNTEEFVFAVNELTDNKESYCSAGLSWLDSLPGQQLTKVLSDRDMD